MKKTIRIMLVEDHPDYRESLTMALDKEADIDLASQFGTAEEALYSLQDKTSRTVPDLILLDLNLPGLSGIEALPLFKQAIPDTKIIVLTQSNKEADVLAAISAGANGYLMKGAARNQIFEGIRTVINGGASLDPNIATYILSTFTSPTTKTDSENVLTKREIEILTLMAEGLLQKEIADRLYISGNTVMTHIRHIYEKLNVPNAPSAVSKAYRIGLFPTKRTLR